MGLEDEIKQIEFNSVYQKLNINLIYTYNWARDKYNKLFSGFNITPQQYNVLRILRGNYPNPYTTSQIRERMLDKMSDASRIVERLVQKGLIDRSICKADKRLVDVVINKSGMDLLKSMDSKIRKADKFFTNLSKKETVQLNNLLDKLRS